MIVMSGANVYKVLNEKLGEDGSSTMMVEAKPDTLEIGVYDLYDDELDSFEEGNSVFPDEMVLSLKEATDLIDCLREAIDYVNQSHEYTK